MVGNVDVVVQVVFVVVVCCELFGFLFGYGVFFFGKNGKCVLYVLCCLLVCCVDVGVVDFYQLFGVCWWIEIDWLVQCVCISCCEYDVVQLLYYFLCEYMVDQCVVVVVVVFGWQYEYVVQVCECCLIGDELCEFDELVVDVCVEVQ